MAEAFGSALLAMYGFAGRVMIPFIPIWLNRRAEHGLEDRDRRQERFGIASEPRPDEPVIWVHAASVGETNAVLPLIARLAEAGWFVVLTTITVTGATTAARNPPEGVLHQFAPVDIVPFVARFLDHWRPHLALFVESEVWPVITDQLSRRSVPHVIVNARMSDRSFRRWRFLGSAPRRVFSRITLALTQSEEDARRLKRLGVRDAKAVGNLKFDMEPPGADAEKLAALRRALGNRPFFLAASTHPGEDEIIADTHQILAERYPGLITAIVPRHPVRGPDIAAMVAKRGIPHWLRSKDAGLSAEGGILIADTLGELGLFYRLTDVAFIGGSLVPAGGHNPAEPVALAAAIVSGPLTGNFAAIYDALEAAGGAVSAVTPEEIAGTVAGLFDDPAALREQTKAAEAAMATFTGALDRTLAALEPYLDKAGTTS
jgi:3-deoxy-D-manno-octulosonic-acid transferase